MSTNEWDDTVAAFLSDGGYDSAEEWAEDSDLTREGDRWYYDDPIVGRVEVDLESVMDAAIESLARAEDAERQG